LGQLEGGSQLEEADGQFLKRARQAMRDGNYQLAEYYVERAEKEERRSSRLFGRFGDSPQKVRRDLAKARAGRDETVPTPSSRFELPAPDASPDRGANAAPADAPARLPDGAIDLMTNRAGEQAHAYLNKARMALAQGNTTAAIGWYHSALATGATFAPDEYSPDDLATELRAAGVDPRQLVPTADRGRQPLILTPGDLIRNDTQIPPVLDQATSPSNPGPRSQFITNPFAVSRNSPSRRPDASRPSATDPPSDAPPSAKRDVLHLLELAQSALAEGQLDRAEQLARRADAFQLPETQWEPDDVRPWQVLMDIARQRRNRDAERARTSARGPLSVQQSQTNPSRAGEAARDDPAPGEFQPVSPAELTQLVPTAPGPPTQLQPPPVLGKAEVSDRQQLPAGGQSQDHVPSQSDAVDRGAEQSVAEFQMADVDVTAQAASHSETTPGAQLDAAGEQLVRVWFNQVAREQAAINRQRQTDPKGAWERLKKLRERVAGAEIDPASREQLMGRVQRAIDELERFIEQNRARIELDERNRQVLDEIDRERQQRVQVQQKLAEFVEEFNTLLDQQRFAEAVVVAKQARELDPLNPVVQTMVWKGQFARQFASSMARLQQSQIGVLDALGSVEDSAVPFNDRVAIEYPEVRFWSDLTDRRRRMLQDSTNRYSEAELEIQQALKKQVEVSFVNQPLAEVMNALGQMAGINVHLDPEGIRSEGVTSDTPITITLRKPVSLRSALNLILQPKRLSFVIQDEVLRITSEQERSGDVYRRVYNVADLVVPIPNFVPSYNMGLAGAVHEAMRSQGAGLLGGQVNEVPLTIVAGSEGMGHAATDKSALAQMGASGLVPNLARGAQPVGFGPGGLGGGPQADFDSLIELITTTIEPDSWDEVGGDGSIAPFETNLSLVVSQTQEVHEQIVDLLRQLRRLQDLQVTIEVRFITLSDNFFERIGVDFDFDIDDNTGLSAVQVQALDDEGPSITVGLDPNGNFTTDLDLQFTQNSLGSAAPVFGGFDPGSAANFGFAILSDIEAFFVIQAAQGDSRTNVLQAPKVTLFNGQSAFVSDSSQRPFVTSVIPVVGDFAAAHQPVITVLSEGTSLNVQAVVSPDRRFVRLTLVPFFSKIGEVDTFTFNGTTSTNTGTSAVDPSDDTTTVQNEAQTITEGTTVQLPTFSFTTVTTTVSVPDGGTILLGGIKRLSEGRLERGLPLMSKIPYVNRLFRNVGIGRETESLMMMVTPRIIIQEEEEERLGVTVPAAAASP
jgi:general secretion pathway protein D